MLAGWSSWGALPQIFEDDPSWESVRTRLRDLLTEDELAAARTTVLNAHYTDPVVVRQIWRAVVELGFAGGRVLEPGCGSGNFIGHAPATSEMVGVELDPITARIAAALYPSATVRAEGFERTRLPEASFVAAVGNVPFGGFALFDPDYNPGRPSWRTPNRDSRKWRRNSPNSTDHRRHPVVRLPSQPPGQARRRGRDPSDPASGQ